MWQLTVSEHTPWQGSTHSRPAGMSTLPQLDAPGLPGQAQASVLLPQGLHQPQATGPADVAHAVTPPDAGGFDQASDGHNAAPTSNEWTRHGSSGDGSVHGSAHSGKSGRQNNQNKAAQQKYRAKKKYAHFALYFHGIDTADTWVLKSALLGSVAVVSGRHHIITA